MRRKRVKMCAVSAERKVWSVEVASWFDGEEKNERYVDALYRLAIIVYASNKVLTHCRAKRLNLLGRPRPTPFLVHLRRRADPAVSALDLLNGLVQLAQALLDVGARHRREHGGAKRRVRFEQRQQDLKVG